MDFDPWSEKDLPLALRLWGDEKVTALIDARGDLSEEQVREKLKAEIATEKEHGIQYWPLFLLKNDEFIGCCGLRPYKSKERILELGFHICSDHWRHGYAKEAARATIKYAFEELNAAALFAGHNPKNEASRYLLEKLGFCYTHDEYYPPAGLDHPSYLLRADDYFAAAETR